MNLSAWTGIRKPVSRTAALLLGSIPVAGLLLLWAALTHGAAEERVISPVILPSPFEVVGSFKSLWFDAGLIWAILASTGRVAGGFAIGLAFAFPLGLMMGAFSRVNALFAPIALFGGYLPIPALVPLTMSLFGIGEWQKVMFLALAFFVYLLPLFVKAIHEVDNAYLQTAYTLGASKAQVLRHVLLGVAFPRLFHAMRLGFGIGWSYIILAEMVAADRGLGNIIIVAQRRGPREHIYLVLVTIVLIAWATDKLWRLLGEWLFPYMEEK
jgi:ABC-type nitrate/sulfonate/bicarbonate transport system permease component